MAAKNKRKQNSNGVSEPKQPSQQQTSLSNLPKVDTNGGNTLDSPLKLFGEAKDKINGLFLKLDSFLTEASNFYSNSRLEAEILNNVDIDRLTKLEKSIGTIRSILSRNQMKVAFFGRTSNGKSTVINAILHDRVLPSGYGHTTGCFLQIQGNHTDEAYFEIMKGGQGVEKKPLQSIEQDVNALNSEALEHSALVKIYWPVSKCPLLKYDVVLVDSPGVDVEDNLDEWIDEHCHDADVFVLVSNAESTLNNAEKKFFHRVSEKLSKPNIFILNNRWDSIAEDPKSMERVRGQHVNRAIEFLSDELKISSREESTRRTFFVSAKETLNKRSPSDQISFDESKRFGFEERDSEFVKFERCFEESLSKSAVQTKFRKHTDRGIEAVRELKSILTTTQSLVAKSFKVKRNDLDANERHFADIYKLFYSNLESLERSMVDIKRNIQINSDCEFDHEISRLKRVVDDFDLKFSPNPADLSYYKEQLYIHVEESLSENLHSRLNSVITKNVGPWKNLLCDICQLLSEDRQKVMKDAINSECFVQDDLFDLRIYKQFYTEFHEDLEFRFSLGLFRIIRKVQSKFSPTKPSHNVSGYLDQSQSLQADTDVISIMERFLMTSPQSPTTVGSLAVGGILVRTVGWRVIVVTSVLYGALYAYEYLTWTNSAKERTFKSQYTKYAKKGLQDCIPIISQHIANSVEQKMSNMFMKVKCEIDTEKTEIQSKVSFLRNSLERLEICESFTDKLLGQNDVLLNELFAFATSFFSIN